MMPHSNSHQLVDGSYVTQLIPKALLLQKSEIYEACWVSAISLPATLDPHDEAQIFRFPPVLQVLEIC